MDHLPGGTIADLLELDDEEERMPYKSAKQRRYMHAKHPTIAAKWDKKYGSKIAPKKSSKKKKKG